MNVWQGLREIGISHRARVIEWSISFSRSIKAGAHPELTSISQKQTTPKIQIFRVAFILFTLQDSV
jgi:hypothetical protein